MEQQRPESGNGATSEDAELAAGYDSGDHSLVIDEDDPPSPPFSPIQSFRLAVTHLPTETDAEAAPEEQMQTDSGDDDALVTSAVMSLTITTSGEETWQETSPEEDEELLSDWTAPSVQ